MLRARFGAAVAPENWRTFGPVACIAARYARPGWRVERAFAPPIDGWGTGRIRTRVRGLEQDFGRGLGLAALRDQLDGAVQVGLALGEALRQRERIAGLDQDVQPPALDTSAVILIVLGDLGRVVHADRFLPHVCEPFTTGAAK